MVKREKSRGVTSGSGGAERHRFKGNRQFSQGGAELPVSLSLLHT